MSEKTKPNYWGIGLFLCAVAYTVSVIMIDHKTKNTVEILQDQVERMNAKADSIYRRQELYEKVIVGLRKDIAKDRREVRVVEKGRTSVYNNYIERVSDYKPDSTIDPYYTRAATKFDSLLYSGFFFKP